MASRHDEKSVMTYRRKVRKGLTNNSSGGHQGNRKRVWWEKSKGGPKLNKPE